MDKKDRIIKALAIAARAAVVHLKSVESGEIRRLSDRSSLPMLEKALTLVDEADIVKPKSKKKVDAKVEILHKGSLMTYLKQGDKRETCIGYLMDFHEHGIHDAVLGRIDVTSEERDVHNKLLSEAEIKGLDESCAVNMGGAFYLDDKRLVVQTFLGTLVAAAEIDGDVVTFRRKGRVFRGRRSRENDIFYFKRIS